MTDYQPIDCALHDRFEAASVRGVPVTVSWDGGTHCGQILDIRVHDGAEYLIMDGDLRIRLDRIEAFAETPESSP